MMRLEIILAEFGHSRNNAGGSTLPVDRLEPSLSSFLKHFPEATATVYTDQKWEGRDNVRVVTVEPPFSRNHARYGWRCNDFYQPHGILNSDADIAIAVDSDLLIASNAVRTIIPLVEAFGLCMPVNGRSLIWRDSMSDCDGGIVEDDTLGLGMCHCTAFIAANPKDERARTLLQAYCDQVKSDAKHDRGARGPLSFWRACHRTGLFPYTLPIEWCITGSNLGMSTYKGRTVPVILHAGHKEALTHYADVLS